MTARERGGGKVARETHMWTQNVQVEMAIIRNFFF